jgi:transposase
MITEGYVCGIDVSAKKLDVALYCDKKFIREWVVENTEEGVAALVHELRQVQSKLTVMEATGGYEELALYRIYEAGLSVARVNPRHTHHFGISMGLLAKQDNIDARVLAEYGIRTDVQPSTLKDMENRAFSAALERRRQLVIMCTAEKNRLKQSHFTVRAKIQRHIDWLTNEITGCEREMHDLVKKMPVWTDNADTLKTAKGVGDIVAFTLLADLPELGTLTAKKIAALVGIAPYNDDSGKRKGYRSCRGGRANVRTILYNATMSATRCQGPIRQFYMKKKAEGKPFKVAIVAAMRKLLTILNAMMRDQKCFRLPAAA